MSTLALADLAGLSEDEIKEHIAIHYGGDKSGFDYGIPTEEDAAALRAELANHEILIAYESVGSWGCDSSSFFLTRKDGKLYENHGGHCSCYGFEGQWSPEETTKETLTRQTMGFAGGGYDDNRDANDEQIKTYIQENL